ncbi:MAG TPA: folylpolyglutamate synthase/dihydrofolate synthase family protein [Nocardioidaceae bacterium]|nr:folylpolyglutamate synthase/dihydrofolate synthase family protein [Nocardioidaceae bacterium]
MSTIPTPGAPGSPAPSYPLAEAALLSRWPETRLEPSLDRIRAMCDLLGDPQKAAPVIHLTGTNGKTSTARLTDSLVRGLGLRTGRFTSPHVESMRERICIDGEPLGEEQFAALFAEVAPYAEVVDRSGPHPVSFFEMMTAMAFAAFADAPVDVIILEVGMGGGWDATNVADATVALITPIAVDHADYLGSSPEEIAGEKAGIIKQGTFAVLAQQSVEVAEVLLRRAVEAEATVAREGLEFGVLDRVPGVGGQMVTLQGLAGEYAEIFVPLHGAHQAHNAVCALAAVEALRGGEAIDIEVVREAFGQSDSPARLEVVRRSPTVVVDAAHNPHGAQAAVEAVQESFAFSPLVGVLGVMGDKDVEGLLDVFEPVMATVVCTQNSTPRSMPAESLGELARGVFGPDRVVVTPRLDDAIDAAMGLAEEGGMFGEALGSGGVLVTGSVITAGEARTLLKATER